MTITGTTHVTFGPPDNGHTLAGATLHFYPYPNTPPDQSLWSWSSVEALPAGALGTAVVDADGHFAAELDGKDGRDLAFQIAAAVPRLAGAPDADREAVGWIGVGVPDDHELDVSLAATAGCDLLRALGLWRVAGRVSDCARQPNPAGGATVTVFDRDLTQDDTLGTASTDAGGYFEVFFTADAFKRIPALPPPFDAVLPFELIGGPDVYFKVEKGGVTLLDEDPSAGRGPGRENRPTCTYVELCVEPPDPDVDSITLWNAIGVYQVPTASSDKDFDADGYVDAGKMAFTGRIDFNGDVAQQLFGNAVRYRFLFAEWPTLGTAPAFPADYQPVLASHITGAPYGVLYTHVGPGPFDYDTTNVAPAPDGDGWIAVSQDPAFKRVYERMVQLDTTTLVAAVDTSGGPLAGAGAPVPPGQQDAPRKFSFRLEVNAGTTTYLNPKPVPIHINNSAAFARFNLDELLADVCQPVASAGGQIVVHPAYTVGHPYLRQFRVTVRRQGGSLLTVVDEDSSTAALPWTGPSGIAATVAATYTDLPSPPRPCSYTAALSFARRLTSGNGMIGGDGPLVRTFCGS